MPEQCACEFGFSHLPTSFKHSLSPYHHTLRTSGFYIGSVAPGGGRFAYTQSDSQQSICIIRGDRNGINRFVPWRRGGHLISGPVRVRPISARMALGLQTAVTVGSIVGKNRYSRRRCAGARSSQLRRSAALQQNNGLPIEPRAATDRAGNIWGYPHRVHSFGCFLYWRCPHGPA